MMEGKINCADFRGIEGVPEPVALVRYPPEVYERGAFYRQHRDMIHETEAVDGTITVMRRHTFRANGTASVFWPIGTDYGDASRSINREDVLKVAQTALLELENNIASRTS